MPPPTSSSLPAHFRATGQPGAVGAGSTREVADRRSALLAQIREDNSHTALVAGEIEATLHQLSTAAEAGVDVVLEASIAEVIQPVLPDTIEKARQTSFWPMVKDALESEIRGKFLDNEAWDVVPRSADMHVIKSKWVLKWTLSADGSIKSVKARLVACGYAQIEGREFTSVYARTLAAPSFRLFCSIVADEDLETDHVDAYKAFTQSTVDCVIYVEMPYGFAKPG